MLDMNKARSLIAFVGLRDPYPEVEDEAGPILALLLDAAKAGKPFEEAWLLCTGGTFLERARDLEREARDEGLLTRFLPMDFPVRDVIDYAEIWGLLGTSLAAIKERAGPLGRDWSFLLDSGTPQMKTSLFLAARSGLFEAALIQGIPPRFAGGAYKAREVRVEGMPEMRLQPPVAAREARPERVESPPPPFWVEAKTRDAEAPVATSASFEEVLRKAASAARYEDPVLILGETGTGKTMIARRIHAASARKSAPFVEVNCSAIAESLAESELFGHIRNAFTGAEKARSGKFRAAHGGTLFLDEVGDLSLDLQAKLLKALEDKAVTPVGSDEAVSADARLIAATNRDLPALIKEGRFRRDLYERLKVVVIELPPLRERRQDVRLLAGRFIDDWNTQYSERRYLTEDALLLLEAYSWPGNVRELRNALRSAACAAASEALGPEALPVEIRGALGARRVAGQSTEASACVDIPGEGINLKARLLQVEWEHVAAALRKAEGNREAAAKLLGMTGHAFRKALRERLAAFADEGWEEGM
ncbi:MAG: sigma 54-interacting transcriptional regulator [Spirochaetaceae bacterium]|nr:sigma 54-interacting transcriptional regulator [Spirochaetaceae bacterium]